METGLSVIREIIPIVEQLALRNIDGVTSQQVEAIIKSEIQNFEYCAYFNPKIMECAPITIKQAFRNVIMKNLSFDPDLKLVHLTTRQFNTGKKVKYKDEKGREVEKEVVETVLECRPSVDGMISYFRQIGVLESVLQPILEYDERGFVSKVTITLLINQFLSSGEIGSRKEMQFVFDKKDFSRWEYFSHRQNSFSKEKDANFKTLDKANKLYSNYYPDDPGRPHSYSDKGGPDPSFIVTKCVRHALNKSKLDKNIYGKRKLRDLSELPPISSFEEVSESVEYVDETEAVAETAEKPSPEIIQKETAPKQSDTNAPLFDAVSACATFEELKSLYEKNVDAFQMDSKLFEHMTQKRDEIKKPKKKEEAPKSEASADWSNL